VSGPLHVQIKVDATGHGKTTIDGKDMSSHIQGVQVIAAVGTPTQVLLAFVDVDVDIEGVVDSAEMGTEWATFRLGKLLRDEMQKEGAKA
jgi:hypothetical protein